MDVARELQRLLLSSSVAGVSAEAGDADAVDEELMALEAILEPEIFEIVGGEENDTGADEEPPLRRVWMRLQPSAQTAPVALWTSTAEGVEGAIRHVGPLDLDIAFPSRYPSSSPPVFIVSADWLMEEALRWVAERLVALWAEEAPEVVLFRWSSWVQEELVPEMAEALGGIPLTRGCVGGSGGGGGEEEEEAFKLDPSAASEHAALMNALMHDAAGARRERAELEHSCEICFETVTGRELQELASPGCVHEPSVCEACLTELASMHVRDGTLDQLKCPRPECREPLHPSLLQRVLDEELWERWERLSVERTIESMEDAEFCPRCNALVIADVDANCGECTTCNPPFVFCILCSAPWHPPSQPCMSAKDRLAILEARASGNRGAASATRQQSRKQAETLMMEMAAKEYCRNNNVRSCPACKMGVEKREGCNKVICRCGHIFCFKCNKEIQGYEHYRDGRCLLFDEETLAAWERHVAGNGGQVAGGGRQNARAAARGWVLARCPKCSQDNFKRDNNNYVRCWSCNRPFCAYCRKEILGKSYDHFGPRRPQCPQHSE